MKKNLIKALALPLFATMLLAACGEEKTPVPSASSTAPTTSLSTPSINSSETPVSSSDTPATSASTPSSISTPTPSSSTEDHEHSYGSWTVEKEPTETEDGVEAKTCECGDKITRAIPRKQIKVDYGFTSESGYVLTDSTRGLKYTVAKGSDGYTALYRPFTTTKKNDAIAYTFKIKNDGADRIELRFGYRDTSVNPRVFHNDSDVSKYSITSRDGHSNTKIREVKDGYFRINIASGDIADIYIPMTGNAYDQFVLMAVHQDNDANFTIIETGWVDGEHHYSATYTSDDTHHWKECTDDGCGFISEKGAHEWVADESKSDVPATEETTGIHYEKCSVCGKTREVVIPKIGAPTEIDVDILSKGFGTATGYTVTPEEGKYKIDYVQNVNGYNALPIKDFADLAFTNATYTTVTVKNLGENVVKFCPVLFNGTFCLAKTVGEESCEMLSSELGTSYFDRIGSGCAYTMVGAGDTATFKLIISGNPTSFNKVRFMCDPAPKSQSSGSIEILAWTIHDKLD